MFFKIGVLKNFAILQYKVAGLKISKKAPTQVFSCGYCEIFVNTIFRENLHSLFLLFLKICKVPNKTLVAEAWYIYLFNKYDR